MKSAQEEVTLWLRRNGGQGTVSMKKPIGIILGIGFLHRLLFLGERQLWTDELMQARVIKSASPVEILSRLRGGMDLASPLDFLVQRGVTAILGDAAWALRLHAVIFGTLSIWFFHRIARFLFGERTALYSAVLFAFYPLAYHYSLEGRPYALLLCLSLLSYDQLLRLVYGRAPSWWRWLLFPAVTTMLLYTSFLGALILVTQLIGLLLVTLAKPGTGEPAGEEGNERSGLSSTRLAKKQVGVCLLGGFCSLALFYPWIRYIWARPQISPVSEIARSKLVLTLIKGLGDNSYPVAGLMLIGAVVGVWVLLKRSQYHPLIWLTSWFLAPIPFLLLVEIWAGYFFSIRHLIHATPPILLLAGHGMCQVGSGLAARERPSLRVSKVSLVYAGLLISMCLWIGHVRARSEPVDWLGTASFLNETVRRGDAVSMPGVNALLEYYSPGLDAYRVDDLDAGPGSLSSADIKRRIVVCYEDLWPSPCGAFRESAPKDPAWSSRSFKGFKVFIRGK